jgi:hypothetical protein
LELNRRFWETLRPPAAQTRTEESSRQKIPLRTLQWGVLASFCLHNLEEAWAMRTQRAVLAELVSKLPLAFMRRELPSTELFYAAVIGATVLGVVVTWVSTRGELTPWKTYLFCALVATVLLNVFVPHLPASLLLWRYTPGVVTAVLCNLPICLAFLKRVREDGKISNIGLIVVLLAAPLTLEASLALIYLAAAALA